HEIRKPARPLAVEGFFAAHHSFEHRPVVFGRFQIEKRASSFFDHSVEVALGNDAPTFAADEIHPDALVLSEESPSPRPVDLIKKRSAIFNLSVKHVSVWVGR